MCMTRQGSSHSRTDTNNCNKAARTLTKGEWGLHRLTELLPVIAQEVASGGLLPRGECFVDNAWANA